MKEVISLPCNINLSVNNIGYILDQYNKIPEKTKEVVLDFSKVKWIDGELTTFLGIISGQLFRKGMAVFTRGITGNAQTILGKNGFLELHGLGTPIEDVYHSTIPYIIINSQEVKKIKQYLDEKVFPKINQHIEEEGLLLIQESIFELLQNVKDHSNSNKVVLCGQYFHKKEKIELAFADLGVSIPFKVENKLDGDLSDCKYIDWATMRGNSTKLMESSGLGLFEIRDNLTGIGKMTIISRNGYWTIDNDGNVRENELASPFPGTLINLTFYLKNNSKRKKNIEKSSLSEFDIFF